MQTVYNSTPVTRIEGNTYLPESDINGNIKTTAATLNAGEDIVNDVTKVQQRFLPTYISTATTTTAKTGPGLLGTVVVQGGTAGTIIGYDNTSASGVIVFSFDSTNALNTYTFNAVLNLGLTVVTGAATKVTVNVA